MGIKSFDERRISSVEVAQLIILYNLFSKKESRDLTFQGGTALRWFHGNGRFSEDLDFVTSMNKEEISALLRSTRSGIELDMKANIGPGRFALKEKENTRAGAFTAFFEFFPEHRREKVLIKLEMERLKKEALLGTEQVILSSSPFVAQFIKTGKIMLPPGRVINIEKVEEILSDKVRALLERRYIKGRDFYDLWFMTKTLDIKPDVELVRRKLGMYEQPFVPARSPDHYIGMARNPGSDVAAKARMEIDRDLSRFVHEDVMSVFRKEQFGALLVSVAETFEHLAKNGLKVERRPAGAWEQGH